MFEQEGLLDDILFLGSQFEKVDYRTAGEWFSCRGMAMWY